MENQTRWNRETMYRVKLAIRRLGQATGVGGEPDKVIDEERDVVGKRNSVKG